MNEINEGVNLKKQAYDICVNYLSGPWRNISLDDLKFQALKGGLSNGLGLFRCSLPDHLAAECKTDGEDIPKEILFRLYGTQTEEGQEEDRVSEIIVFTILSEKNLGPKLCGIFPGGRLEEYLPSRSCIWSDYPGINTSIAKEMAKIHSLQMPIKKTPAFVNHMYQWIDDFIEIAKAKKSSDIPEIISNGEYKAEVDWLESQIKKLNPDVVFCHNDIQGGNILLLDDVTNVGEKKTVFIDFEFGQYNYRSFDIGMYFIEQCFHYNATISPFSFDANFENLPTKAEQERFVDVYVKQLKESDEKFKANGCVEKKKKEILSELPILQLGPLLLWQIWCYKSALNPTSDFPFLEHGYARWNMYKKLKAEVIK